MKDWPPVTILLVTYDRPEELRHVIRSLLRHLCYAGELRWHIADDGSPVEYLQTLRNDFPELDFTTTRTNRKGWGANVNKGLHCIETDYVYLNEDDYVALKKIDLGAGVALMEAVEQVGLVRYDGVAGHVGLILELCEISSPFFDEKLDYFVADRRKSLTLYVYSNRPHLVHVPRFHGELGYYPTGKALGATEECFAHTVKHAKDCPDVAVFWDGIGRGAFEHIGKSRQYTEADPCRE